MDARYVTSVKLNRLGCPADVAHAAEISNGGEKRKRPRDLKNKGDLKKETVE